MSRRNGTYPAKRTMNLYYKPDRTTKPATVALYVLFVLAVLLGLSKVLVYDLWQEAEDARQTLETAQSQLDHAMAELAGYEEVEEQYFRYAATGEERALIGRMDILDLVDQAISSTAQVTSITISGSTCHVQFSAITLVQTAQIVAALEASPIVAGTVVHTAATTEEGSVVQANIQIQLQKESAT